MWLPSACWAAHGLSTTPTTTAPTTASGRYPGKRLPWQQFLTIRSEIYECSDHDGVVHHVDLLHPLVDVLAGVMRARAVLDRVLDELEARQPDGVERLVIRPTGIAWSDVPDADAVAVERGHPLREDRPNSAVTL